MTSRSKFVIQLESTVWQQSVENVILVPQNPLEQIVIHVVSEFGCCQDVRTAQSRAHTPADDCLHSLPISCRSRRWLRTSLWWRQHSENCLYRLLAHAMGRQGSNWTDCAHELMMFCTWALTDIWYGNTKNFQCCDTCDTGKQRWKSELSVSLGGEEISTTYCSLVSSC